METKPAVNANDLMVMTDVGLEFRGEVPWEALEETGKGFKKYIRFYQKNLRWAVGDFIIYAKRRFPEKYTQLLEAEMYTEGTLRNCEYVCSRIPPHLRNPNLSFEHHYQVARLHPDDMKRILDEAEKNDWSMKEIRRAAVGEYPVASNALPAKVEDGRRLVFEMWYDDRSEGLMALVKKDAKAALWEAWLAGKKSV